jgi:hypothetical protein
MSDVLEINVATGERIERDFTAEEKAQRKADEAAAKAAADEAAAKAEADAAATAAAVAHAKSLGFTDAMIAVMYPNLAP